jgi:predicted transposase YdaD
VEGLLRGFLPEDWTVRLDFSTLEKVGNSFVSDDLRERHGDLIWRLRFNGAEGGWFYLYLLLEFQSTSDPSWQCGCSPTSASCSRRSSAGRS